MNIEYILLFFTSLSCFLKQRNISIFLLFCSFMTAYASGTINNYGILGIIGFYTITHTYFQRDIASKLPRTILLLIILVTVILFSFHLLPGFNNALVVDGLRISQLSIPFSIYLNFDKTIAGIILFMNNRLYEHENPLDSKSIILISKLLFLCATILMTTGILYGYIKFDFKIPNILLIWCINNLFFICLSEEVIFRGIIQNKLEEFSSSKYFSLTLASLIFGLAHFKGGIAYILLATIVGGFYGLAYQKTRRVLCAMLVHFGLNLIHLIFFTYPKAIKIMN
jgi:membrane protease YdiL (CAAX protease family)